MLEIEAFMEGMQGVAMAAERAMGAMSALADLQNPAPLLDKDAIRHGQMYVVINEIIESEKA